jgi:hypothetical protein
MKTGLAGILGYVALILAAEASYLGLAWKWSLALLALCGTATCLGRTREAGFASPASLALLIFAAWLTASNAWLSPSYTPAAPFHAAFLLGGYVVGWNARGQSSKALECAALLFGATIASLGIWQLAQGAARAQALFQTPATFGSVLNLLMVPVAIHIAAGRRERTLLAAGVALAAGLFAANSRGAWIALAAGLLVALIAARRASLRIETRSLVRLVAVLAAGSIATELLGRLAEGLTASLTGHAPARELEYSPLSADALLSSVGRLGLYSLALHGLTPFSLLAGSGYLGFFYLMETAGQSIASYEGGNTTFFVHNDYLQILLELGVPGAVALAGMVTLPLIAAVRVSREAQPPPSALRRAGFAGAVASMAFQACVDFPFYVPACLVIFGAAVGLLEGELPRPRGRMWEAIGYSSRAPWVLASASLVAGWLLVAPLAAELAAKRADAEWRAARGESAAYWLQVARRLEPKDWRYHWYAGQFWYAQAQGAGKPTAARLADEAFRAAADANPRDVRPLVGLIRVHRTLAPLLTAVAGPEELRRWSQRAVELAPNDEAALRERDLVRRQLSR